MLDQQDQELLNRFRNRTLYSLGGPEVVEIYEKHLMPASFTVSLVNQKYHLVENTLKIAVSFN